MAVCTVFVVKRMDIASIKKNSSRTKKCCGWNLGYFHCMLHDRYEYAHHLWGGGVATRPTIW